ncbi:MAG: hypothetical protein ACI84E_000133 [Planctomycetota bacterium]|jgi:hypothetical protein
MLHRIRAIALLSIFCASCLSAPRIPSDATSLLPAASLDGWVGGSTYDPGELASSSEDERTAKLTEWTTAAREHWHIEGKELVSDGHGPHLVTATDYGDFELWLDWKLLPNGDSGIYLRGYPQVQLWDPANEKEWGNGSDQGSGALWNNQTNERFPLALADAPAGEWNEMYVKLVGDLVTVVLNGQLVVDEVILENYFHRGQAIRSRGPIHLQTHGSETRFRNLFLREL